MFNRIIGEHIRLTLELSSQDIFIDMDQNQLIQITLNLIINARDAMPEGGAVTIRTDSVSGKNDRYALIAIKDDGIGMSKDIQSKIFDPFFTTKAIGKGTGLGMSVVYGIIQSLKGKVEIESAPMKGSEISLFIPESKASSVPQQDDIKAWDQRSFAGKGKLVLLIEDDTSVLKYTKKILEKFHMKVLSASNTKDASQQIENNLSKLSLIVCDVILEDGNGIDLLSRQLDQKSRIKVLFYSGYSDQKSQKDIIQSRGYHFIQKPFQTNDFIIKIHEILS